MRTADNRAWLSDKRVRGDVRESTAAQGRDDRFGPDIQKHAQEQAAQRYGTRELTHYYVDLVSGTNVLKRSECPPQPQRVAPTHPLKVLFTIGSLTGRRAVVPRPEAGNGALQCGGPPAGSAWSGRHRTPRWCRARHRSTTPVQTAR